MSKDLSVKGIYGSGMVLQRDKINCIYGTGDVFSDVIMSFRGVTSITQVDENGNWKFEFSPGEAGGPFQMVIKSDAQKIEFDDIYVGEVWLNAGGGNAALTMEEMKFSYPEEFYLPGNLNIRMINVPANYSFKEKIDYVDSPVWNYANAETLENMPGIAYFFAKKLSVDLSVPVGVINVAFPDTPIVSWISKKGIEEMGDKSEDLKVLEEFEDRNNVAKAESLIDEADEWKKELSKALPSADFGSTSGWSAVSVPGRISELESNGLIWLKKEFELSQIQLDNFGVLNANLWLGVISCPDEVFLNGNIIGSTFNAGKTRRYEVPTSFLKAGKNQILVKLQKNTKEITFIPEKQYCIFSNNFAVSPSVSRNIECQDISLAPIDGEYISLEGQWEMKVGMFTANPPTPALLTSKPTAIYNGVLPACFKYAVAGVIWCHGEADFDRAAEYKGFLTKLITVWRRRFTFWSKDLPFVVVQLPNWAKNGVEGDYESESSLAVIRNAQASVSSLIEKVGLVVTIDAGEWNDLYGEKKSTIGTRCEFEALRLAYGKYYISPAPRYSSVELKDNKYVVKFDCGNSSLHTFQVHDMAANLSQESSDNKVYGFTFLYQADGGQCLSAAANARLVDANTVEVEIPENCSNILELRYLWADCPAPVNLYSRDMIPAAPFSYSTVS